MIPDARRPRRSRALLALSLVGSIGLVGVTAGLGACTTVAEGPADATVLGDSVAADTSTAPDADHADATDDAVDTADTALSDADALAAGDVGPEDTAAPADASPPDDATAPLVACDPPLTITPAAPWTPARALITFVAAGGTGAYRFALAVDASGASLNPTTGAYLSGATAGVTDEVRLTDLGCAGDATAAVSVALPLAIVPAAAEVAPTTGQVTFTVVGGSGEVAFSLAADATGAALDPDGAYVAGAAPGDDRVRVVDLATGESAEAVVHVVAGARLRLSPERLFIPVGERYALALVGGSGHAAVALAAPSGGAEPPVGFADGWFIAHAPGVAPVTLTDLHTGQTATTTVTAVASVAPPSLAAGDSNWQSHALAPGDLDGDGFDDVIVTVMEADLDAWDSGGVFIYAGTAAGLAPSPVRAISGPDRADRLGRAVAVGDLDGDGLLDLVVGAPDSDLGGTNSGAAFLYPGVPGGFFADEPTRTFVGRFASDAHATSLAICDFNGDGWLDLALGARLGEDRGQSPVASNSGGVHVHLGGPSGLSPQPDQSLWGQLPDGAGGWRHVADMQLGWALVAADLDGDDRCDLAATGLQYASSAGRSQDGAVLVFRGRGPDSLSPGGLSELPVLAFVGDEADAPQSRLGWALAAGDLDGDGLADLAIGQPYYNAGATSNNGSVRVVRGGALPSSPAAATLGPDDADWAYYAGYAQTNDYFGWSVAIADTDGAPPRDLLVGNIADEVQGGPANTGTVHVLAGVMGAFPELTPTRVVGGDTGGQRFGVAAAAIADRDDDGDAELVVRAAYDNADGPRAGRTWLAASGGDRVALETPLQPAGGDLGAAVALLPDLDGDGLPELAVGGPRVQASPVTGRIRAGAVALHRGVEGGFAPEAAQVLDGFSGHSTDDRFGAELALVDDFDGDGAPELAVVALLEDTGGACSPARNNGGAVYLFRAPGPGLDPAPAVVYHGDQAGQNLHRVTSADLDGDGLADLIVTSRLWDGPDAAGLGRNVGGGAVIFGRALPASGPPLVLCEADWTFLGHTRDAQLGSAVAGLGDVDGDGCEDVAIGARLDRAPAGGSGSVRVLFGWGPACASVVPRVVLLTAFVANSQVGSSLWGGVDVDGDGISDLAVGGEQYRDGVNAVGAAWLVPGSYLASLSASAAPWEDGAAPPTFALGPSGGERLLRVEGRLAGELFGAAVALVPAASAGGYGALAVGRPLSDLAGVTGAGAVSVYGWTEAGLDPRPVAGMGGETGRPGSEPGRALAAGRFGARAVVAVGAPRASAVGLDDGGAYGLVFDLTP